LSQFKVFADDWLNYTPVLDQYILKEGKILIDLSLSENFFDEINFDKDSLQKYRLEAAHSCVQGLGNDIALCFSGGIDSQAMLQCFVEADIPFKLYTLKFDEDLNMQDVGFARYIAHDIYKIKLANNEYQLPTLFITSINLT